MKHILVVFTGGTIGSSDDTVIDLDIQSKYNLLNMYKSVCHQQIQFDILEPLSVLSENMTIDALYRLLSAISSVDFRRYDGVIITHGSDTLSYTSAFIGLLFGKIGKPIVLVAANKPLNTPGSNGLENFTGAVDFILDSGLCGVFAIYKNHMETEVFLATRILEADSYFEYFAPFGDAPFGKMDKGRFIRNDFPGNPEPDDFYTGKRELTTVRPFHKKVLVIKPYLGMDYRFISFSDKPAAVLHLAYHSGTACTAGDSTSFLAFAKRALKEGIPLYVLPFKQDGENLYASSQKMITGDSFISLSKMSAEAAYAKLVLAYNLFDGDDNYIKKNVFFEYLI